MTITQISTLYENLTVDNLTADRFILLGATRPAR